MNEALTRISILLLVFYMAWFMWDQHKLIQNQREKIQQLEVQSFYDLIIINELQEKQYYKNNNPI
jgi:hypothetical protein